MPQAQVFFPPLDPDLAAIVAGFGPDTPVNMLQAIYAIQQKRLEQSPVAGDAGEFKEEEHPRGGDPKHSGRFSAAQGGKAAPAGKKWLTNANKQNMSHEVAAHISKILDDLSERFPAAAKYIKGIEFSPSTTNEFDAFSKKLRVTNAELGGSVEDLDRWHEHANKPGFAVSGGIRALLTHEFGHGVDHAIIASGDEDTKDRWFETKKRLQKEMGAVSEYAKRNTQEWFAEQFTAERLGKSPEKLIPVIDKFLGVKDNRTADRAPADTVEPGGFLTVTRIGPNRGLTPEGFLHCREVPVARTGLQLYGPGETPIQYGISGVVRVMREPEEVFAPEAMASLQGKPVVDEHPEEDGLRIDVNPANWQALAVGTVINPRRGTGALEDFLVADLIIYTPAAIELIGSGKRELSVGYDCDYAPTGEGSGRQTNIRANHVALVERGRCGPNCAIGDAMLPELTGHRPDGACDCAICCAAHQEEKTEMATAQATAPPAPKVPLRDRIRAAFFARDQEGLEKALEERGEEAAPPPPANGNGNGAEHHVHVHLPGAGEAAAAPADNGAAPPPAAAAGGGGDPGELLRQAVTGIHQEMDEMWDAINSVAGGSPIGDSYPHRDRRRGSRDSNGEEEKKTEDELGEAPSATSGGRTILPGFEIEAPPGTLHGDARKARDSALFEESFLETLAAAEILVPGISLPTFDKAAKPKATFDQLCGLRRRVMDMAFNHNDTRPIIEAVTQGRFAGASEVGCERLRDWFFAAAALKAQHNNAGNARGGRFADAFGAGNAEAGPILSNTEWQKALDKYYADRHPPRQ